MIQYFKTAGQTGCFSYMHKWLFFVIIIGVLVCLHLPFSISDPDKYITDGRGPFTDEGLNTCQIRNYINHNDLTLKKSDNFVKTPLFGIILYTPFKLFGTSQLTGRLTILTIVLFIFFLILRKDKYYRNFGILVFLLVLIEYYIFHYSYYCLAEIVSTCLIFYSIFLLANSIEKKSYKLLIYSAIAMSLSYYLKIQFLYVGAILPSAIIIFLIFRPGERKWLFNVFLYVSVSLIFMAFFYYITWYLPNKDFYDYVMSDQTKGRFIGLSGMYDYLDLIIHYYFYNNYLLLYSISFLILFFIGFIYLFISDSIRYKFLFTAFSCWLIFELHKLIMTYLPSRYLVSLFFAMGLIMVVVCNEMFSFKKYKWLHLISCILAVVIISSMVVKNSVDYICSYKRRTYEISKIDEYLAHYDFGKNPVIGAWAPSLTWKSNAISFPVWRNYFNDKNVIEVEKPMVIISETGEEDSDRAYQSQNIDIDNMADSIKYFRINNWDLKLLWIRKNK